MDTRAEPPGESAVVRGRLRIYLGAAAGVGTTYAMLDEGLRRRERGAEVVIGCVNTHGRLRTAEQVRRLAGEHDVPTSLDLRAVLSAPPDLVLVDELAHRNPLGALNEFRWQDVEMLVAHGIDVITTLSIQHVDSLADTVRRITGNAPEVRVPDDFLRTTDQIEVIDISPAAIRRRIAHGNVFGPLEARPGDVDLFSTNAFADLRALMMFWMADRLVAGADDPRGAREKVVVAVGGSQESDEVLRRASRLAHRSRAQLVGVHVVQGPTSDGDRQRRRHRIERLGGVYHEVGGTDLAEAILVFAEAQGATQIVLGASTSSGRRPAVRGTIAASILARPRTADIHIVATSEGRDLRRRDTARRILGSIGGRRIGHSLAGITALSLLTVALAAGRDAISVATSLAIYLLAVVGITALGGAWPGLTAAVTAPLLANWFLIPPYHTLRIADGENILELGIFVSVASIVSWYVSVAARRAAEAQRAEREAATLASLTGSGHLDVPQSIVDHLRSTFDLEGVAVLASTASEPPVLATSGNAPSTPDDADLVFPLASGYVVAANGPLLAAADQRVLRSFLGELSRAFEQQRLREVAAEAEALARADELRTAILRAVSHDLRSPLATIKASVSSLRQSDVEWPTEVRGEFLESIEDEADHLTIIITNLLDLSRLEAGILRPLLRSVMLEEVIPGCLVTLGTGARRVVLDLDPDLPEVVVDPALLERIVANLLDNALHWSPCNDVVMRAHRRGQHVLLQVIDQGPGIPVGKRQSVLQPFNRLDDSATGGGLGLGLAIADRLVEAMGGSLDLRDTPGGGLTVALTLPSGES